MEELLDQIYNFCFVKKQFPTLESLQYIWACLVIGNSKGFFDFFVRFIEGTIVGILPRYLMTKFMHWNEYVTLQQCFVLFILIFLIFQFLPINKIAVIHLPIIIPIHAVIIIRRFMFIISRFGMSTRSFQGLEILLSICTALFISGCDTFFIFACRRIERKPQSKYCDRMGFFRAISGCIFYIVGMIVFDKNDHLVAVAAALFIAFLDFISIAVGENRRMKKREAKLAKNK